MKENWLKESINLPSKIEKHIVKLLNSHDSFKAVLFSLERIQQQKRGLELILKMQIVFKFLVVSLLETCDF